MKCSECEFYYADWDKGHDYEEGNRPYCHFMARTVWDNAPCEGEHEEPSDDPELWDDEESEENEMGWTDQYTKDEVEFIINCLLDFMMEKRLEDFNNGWIEEDDLTTELMECGFTKKDAYKLYNLEGGEE